jgi:hypothetical protein
VIYNCLSLDVDQQQDLGKPSLKIAKPSQWWEAVGRPVLGGEWKAQSALREEQGWTHSL